MTRPSGSSQRLDRCVELLRTNRLSGTPRPKVLAYLTTADFDNAYVQPQVGGLPLQMVLTHHFTTEFFNLLEIGVNHVDDVVVPRGGALRAVRRRSTSSGTT